MQGNEGDEDGEEMELRKNIRGESVFTYIPEDKDKKRKAKVENARRRKEMESKKDRPDRRRMGEDKKKNFKWKK